MWGRTTRERIGKDRHRFIDSVSRREPQICQPREWPVHRRQYVFQIRTGDVSEVDLTHAIAVLEYCNDVIHIFYRVAAPNGKRQGWPDIQHVPRGCSGGANKSQLQATWRSKNDAPPSSTHVDQCLPRLYLVYVGTEIKYC